MAAHAAAPPHGAAASLIRFGRLWLALFVLSVAAAAGANLIAHVPIAAVVDVILASTVFVMAALLLFELFQAGSSVIGGHTGAAVGRLIMALTALVLPAAPILAFDGYAWLTHTPLLGASDIYDAVIGWIQVGMSGPAKVISDVILFCLSDRGGYGNYISQAEHILEGTYYALGIFAALHAARTNTKNGFEAI